MKRLTLLPLLLLALACGSNGSTPVPDVLRAEDLPTAELAGEVAAISDAASDGASLDVLSPDTEPADVGPQDPCAAPFKEPIALFPGGPSTQIHVAAASDGQSVWVAFSVPDDDGKFDVQATRIGCTGQVLVEPFLLHETPLHSELDPAIAISGDTVLVAWQQDNGQFPDNLSTYFRIFGVDGALLDDALVELPTLAPQTPTTANSWMPAVAATESGFAIATAAAVQGAQGFQIVLTGVGADGTVAQTSTLAAFEAEASQIYPAVAYHKGDLIVAWTRTVADGDDKVQIAYQDNSGTMLPPADALEGGSSFSASVTGGDGAYLAFDSGNNSARDIVVRSVSEPTFQACVLGAQGQLNRNRSV